MPSINQPEDPAPTMSGAKNDGTPVPPRPYLAKRLASAAWEATRSAGLALQAALMPDQQRETARQADQYRAVDAVLKAMDDEADRRNPLRTETAMDSVLKIVAPKAYVAAKSAAALQHIPGEELPQRFERLSEVAAAYNRDTTNNSPERATSAAITKALAAEARPHILSHEQVLQEIVDYENEVEASVTLAERNDGLEYAASRLHNHIAASNAVWGYDPVNVNRILEERATQQVEADWRAMTPVERMNTREAYAHENALGEYELRFSSLAHAYQGEAAKAFDRAWAAGLNDSQRTDAIVATADSIKHEGEKARRGEGWDAEQHAALRGQLALLAEGRMSDRDLAALRDQETALLEKRDEAGLTRSEQAKLDELTRRTTLAAVANMALFQVGHGLDTAKAEAHSKDRADIDRIMNDGEHVELDEGTPEWGRAWEGLREHLQATGLGDGTEVLQPSYSQRTWQWMGSAELDGQIAHTFRHGDHPNTGRAEFASVRDGSARDLADDRSAKLEVANSH